MHAHPVRGGLTAERNAGMEDDDYALVIHESGRGAVVVSRGEEGDWLVYAPGWAEVLSFQTRLQAVRHAEQWLRDHH